MRTLDVNYKKNLEAILENYQTTTAKVERIIPKDLKNIIFTGCGANYSQMKTIKYIYDDMLESIGCYLYHAGELDIKVPNRITDKSLVLGMSHSGNTTEVCYSLEKAQSQGAKLIGISSSKDSKLAQLVDLHIEYPDGGSISELKILILLIVLFAIGKAVGNQMPKELEQGLYKLPELLYQYHYIYKEGALKFAEECANRNMVYSVGAGPTMGPAFAFANCKLMEMQWKDASVINACNFFHGPIEVVDDERYFLLFAAGNKQSTHVHRVRDYLDFKNAHYHFIDPLTAHTFSSNLVMEYYTPLLLWPALTMYAWTLEEKTGHNLDVRRNMGEEGIEYF